MSYLVVFAIGKVIFVAGEDNMKHVSEYVDESPEC